MALSGQSNYSFKLDFPITKNADADNRIRQHLRWACEVILNYLGEKNLRAIVLSGSLAIGEGSAVRNPNGEINIFSDMDISIIANEEPFWFEGNEDRHKLLTTRNNSLNAALNESRPSELLTPIDTMIFSSSQIQNWWITPRIVTIQLSGTARVIWGDDNLLPDTPPVSVNEIADEDIFKLFNNRIAEQVFYRVRYEDGLDSTQIFVFHTAKAAVDAVLATCVAAGVYENGLLNRINKFKKLCSETQLGTDIADWGEFWSRYKVSPDPSSLFERFDTNDMGHASILAWEESAGLLIRCMCWVTNSRLGYVENDILLIVRRLVTHFEHSTSKKFNLESTLLHPKKYLRYLIKTRNSTRLFVKELFAACLKAPGPNRSRELMTKGSPRSLTYGAAALLLHSTSKSENDKREILRIVANMLPTEKTITASNSSELWWNLARETGHLWNILIMGGRR